MEQIQNLNINNLTYNQKEIIYNKLFSCGSTLSNKLTDKFKLIYLVSLVTFKMKQKDNEITSKDVLEKIFHKKLDNPKDGIEDFLSTIAIIAQDLLFSIEIVDILNYTKPSDIINDIKTLVEAWIPF